MERPAADQAEITEWLDDGRVIRALDRYFRALDEKHFDETHFRRLFTSDARVIRPNGAATTGPVDIMDSHVRSFSRFEATQHLLTGHDVDLDGDTAAVRANLVAIHIWNDRPAEASMHDRSFTAGGVVTAQLSRTTDGWQIAEVQNRAVWRTGFFGDMLQTR